MILIFGSSSAIWALFGYSDSIATMLRQKLRPGNYFKRMLQRHILPLVKGYQRQIAMSEYSDWPWEVIAIDEDSVESEQMGTEHLKQGRNNLVESTSNM